MNLDVLNHHLRSICSILDFDIAELWVTEPSAIQKDSDNRLVFTHSLIDSFIRLLLFGFAISFRLRHFHIHSIIRLVDSLTY